VEIDNKRKVNEDLLLDSRPNIEYLISHGKRDEFAKVLAAEEASSTLFLGEKSGFSGRKSEPSRNDIKGAYSDEKSFQGLLRRNNSSSSPIRLDPGLFNSEEIRSSA